MMRITPARLGALAIATLTLACGGPAPDRAAEHDTTEAHEGAESRVTLTDAAVRTAGIVVETAGAAAGVVGTLSVPGEVQSDPSRVALISPRAPGRLERLTVVIGDTVTAGQVVAVISSPSYLTAQSDFVQAARRARLLANSPDSAGALGIRAASERRLRLLGGTDETVARLAAGGEPELLLGLTAPFGGSIVEGLALAGAAVEPGTPVFRLVDLSELDVSADVAERALPSLRIGQRAVVTLAAYPGTEFTGRVERIKDELDPTTRTIEALIHVRNVSRRLRPGMFASVRLALPPARVGAAIVLPESAVLTDGAARIVFVEVAPRTFERREVEAEAMAEGGQTLVRRGLAPGDRVVVRGAFVLKSELAKAAWAEEQ
jgi:multidrug efflux pump subunit AcrA (membrane-fusion protein)